MALYSFRIGSPQSPAVSLVVPWQNCVWRAFINDEQIAIASAARMSETTLAEAALSYLSRYASSSATSQCSGERSCARRGIMEMTPRVAGCAETILARHTANERSTIRSTPKRRHANCAGGGRAPIGQRLSAKACRRDRGGDRVIAQRAR